jgi:hypothetical protein
VERSPTPQARVPHHRPCCRHSCLPSGGRRKARTRPRRGHRMPRATTVLVGSPVFANTPHPVVPPAGKGLSTDGVWNGFLVTRSLLHPRSERENLLGRIRHASSKPGPGVSPGASSGTGSWWTHHDPGSVLGTTAFGSDSGHCPAYPPELRGTIHGTHTSGQCADSHTISPKVPGKECARRKQVLGKRGTVL